MLNSAEVRWFWDDLRPLGLEDWFRSGGFPPGGGELRWDSYLIDPGQIELGIKRRGKKDGVEVKGLVSTAMRPLRSDPPQGTIQMWSKWTSQSLILDEKQTLNIQKTRWLRKFSTDAEVLREIALNADEMPCSASEKLPLYGCNIELTKILNTEMKFLGWTLGFEAFGTMSNIEQSLRLVWEHLTTTGFPPIEGSVELSYPAWLSQHLTKKGPANRPI
jgi:hypothetical protein